MTTLDDLLQAVLANPADDVPRLVMADMLEERSAPGDLDRATFIRAGVAIARRG